ncbi:MAG TPA: preprotein translocase subunit SecE [Ottowia sp.]|uniref:preprotein translocase subunit SecE n=1 Tax=Ottowia sp. TaxID=1898956 RepID=UPI002CEBC739|nr:preprotein translocase subunit SecE [Ottowia sp.]HMN22699.1 preprotein translocase subunit SecE [Ottowia sp.]
MASTQIETVSTGVDKAKLVLAALLVIGGVAAYYLLASQGVWAQWGGLIGGLVLAALAFLVSESGRRLVAFGRDSWREMHKVVWPARKDALQTTAFVFAFSVAIALFMWVTDQFLQWSLYDLILGWRR